MSGMIASLAAVVQGGQAAAEAGHFEPFFPGLVVLLPLLGFALNGILALQHARASADAVRDGAHDRARELHFRLLGLMRTNFAESNPVPVKCAMALLGFCDARVRPPLGEASEATRGALRTALEQAGLSGDGR